MDFAARFGGQDGQVTGFVDEVAGIEQALFIDDEDATLNRDTGKEGWSGDDAGSNRQPDSLSRNETMRSTMGYGISAVYYACIAHRHKITHAVIARWSRTSRTRAATTLNDDL